MNSAPVKALRASKGIKQQEVADHRSPNFFLRKRSMTRTAKTKNLKASVGRSIKMKDLHYMLRKDNVAISSRKDQKTIIEEILADDAFTLDCLHYIISASWFNEWKASVAAVEEEIQAEQDGESTPSQSSSSSYGSTDSAGVPIPRLRPIDNSSLLVKDDELRRDLSPSEYVILPKKAYKKLIAWYGGGPDIGRPCVILKNKLQVELHPLSIRIMKVNTEEIKPFFFSENSTMREVRRRIASSLAVPLLKCTLFQFEEELTKEEHLNKTLKQLDIKSNQIILMRNMEDKVILTGRVMGVTNVKAETTLVEKQFGKPIEQISYTVKINEAGFFVPPVENRTHTEVYAPKKEMALHELKQIADDFVESQRTVPATNN